MNRKAWFQFVIVTVISASGVNGLHTAQASPLRTEPEFYSGNRSNMVSYLRTESWRGERLIRYETNARINYAFTMEDRERADVTRLAVKNWSDSRASQRDPEPLFELNATRDSTVIESALNERRSVSRLYADRAPRDALVSDVRTTDNYDNVRANNSKANKNTERGKDLKNWLVNVERQV